MANRPDCPVSCREYTDIRVDALKAQLDERFEAQKIAIENARFNAANAVSILLALASMAVAIIVAFKK